MNAESYLTGGQVSSASAVDVPGYPRMAFGLQVRAEIHGGVFGPVTVPFMDGAGGTFVLYSVEGLLPAVVV